MFSSQEKVENIIDKIDGYLQTKLQSATPTDPKSPYRCFNSLFGDKFSIKDYLLGMAEKMRRHHGDLEVTAKVFISMLICLEDFLKQTGLPLEKKNVQRLLLVSLIVVQKYLTEGIALKNKDFHQMDASMPLSTLAAAELVYLKAIKFKLPLTTESVEECSRNLSGLRK